MVIEEAYTRVMEAAYGNPDKRTHPHNMLPFSYTPAEVREVKEWRWTPIDAEEQLSVVVEASRLRAGRTLEILDHECQKDLHRERGSDTEKRSKFQTVRVPLHKRMAGFSDFVITNAHLNNVIAKTKKEKREQFFNRLA